MRKPPTTSHQFTNTLLRRRLLEFSRPLHGVPDRRGCHSEFRRQLTLRLQGLRIAFHAGICACQSRIVAICKSVSARDLPIVLFMLHFRLVTQAKVPARPDRNAAAQRSAIRRPPPWAASAPRSSLTARTAWYARRVRQPPLRDQFTATLGDRGDRAGSHRNESDVFPSNTPHF